MIVQSRSDKHHIRIHGTERVAQPSVTPYIRLLPKFQGFPFNPVVGLRVADDGQVIGIGKREGVRDGLRKRFRRFLQMRVEKLVELRLGGEERCRGRREAGREQRADQRDQELPADGVHGLGFEKVADAAHGLDGAVGELLSQMVDVNLDGVRAHGIVPVVELLLELGAAPDDALAFGEGCEQSVLLGGEDDGLAIEGDFARGGGDPQGAALDDRVRTACGAAQQGAHAGGELVEFIGLDQIVVGTAVEALDSVVDGVAGGRHENGRRVASGADLLENLKAVLAGQAKIEDDEGKRRGLHGEQRGLSVTDPVDCVVLAFKEGNEAFTDHVIVFSDKNSHVFSLDIVDAGGRARSSARRPP